MINKKSGKPTVSWSEAVDEALCFGWIDSLKKKLDADSSIQYFGKRKPKSTWSKINKQKIEKLTAENRMSQAGLDIIKTAKENGSWEILDSVEELIIPDDLLQALSAKENAIEFFQSLSKSIKKNDALLGHQCKKTRNKTKKNLGNYRNSKKKREAETVLKYKCRPTNK